MIPSLYIYIPKCIVAQLKEKNMYCVLNKGTNTVKHYI